MSRTLYVEMPDGPITVEATYAPMPHHLAGLSYTRSGYGGKIPLPYKIRVNGRDRRVYVMIWSNSGTCYVIVNGTRVYVND